MDLGLEGRTAIITGGSKGIGYAAAESLAREGCHVHLAARTAADLEAAPDWYDVADWLMFDARPPKEMTNALPGGNALAFDWLLLKDWEFPLPWMLAGGLNGENVAEAVRLSGTRYVDTSSGVEDKPGVKSPEKIRQFLKAVAAAG